MVKLLRDRGSRRDTVTRREVLRVGALAVCGGLAMSRRVRARAGVPQEPAAGEPCSSAAECW